MCYCITVQNPCITASTASYFMSVIHYVNVMPYNNLNTKRLTACMSRETTLELTSRNAMLVYSTPLTSHINKSLKLPTIHSLSPPHTVLLSRLAVLLQALSPNFQWAYREWRGGFSWRFGPKLLDEPAGFPAQDLEEDSQFPDVAK